MTREFILTSIFDKRWKELNLTDPDLQTLQNFIIENPQAGDIIEGTGGAIKLRYALPNKGKSGGIRVIYVDIAHKAHLHLLLCYSKKEQDNLTHEQKKQVKALTKILKGE